MEIAEQTAISGMSFFLKVLSNRNYFSMIVRDRNAWVTQYIDWKSDNSEN